MPRWGDLGEGAPGGQSPMPTPVKGPVSLRSLSFVPPEPDPRQMWGVPAGPDELAASQKRIEEALARLLAEVSGLRGDFQHQMSKPDVVGRELSTVSSVASKEQVPPPRMSILRQDGRQEAPPRRISFGKMPSSTESDGPEAESRNRRLSFGKRSSSADQEPRLTTMTVGLRSTGGRDIVRHATTRPALGLPQNWPCSIRLREIGVDFDSVDFEERTNAAIALAEEGGIDEHSRRREQIELDAEAANNSIFHAMFSMLAFLVLFHDLTVIPYVLAWDLPFSGWVQVNTISSAAFWVLEIAVTIGLGTCFRRDPWAPVAKSTRLYCRTWLILDVIMVSCDILFITLTLGIDGSSSDAGGLRMVRFVKLMRLLRIAGFLRVLKVATSLYAMLERMFSDSVKLLVHMMAFALGTMWYTHMMACAWFAVGTIGYSDTGHRWVDTPFELYAEIVDYRIAPRGFQYLTAVHWALQQLTMAGTVETSCANSSERLFNIICMLIGFMLGSILLSTLCSGMVDMRTRRLERDTKMRSLRRYLRQNSVDPFIAMRAIRQVEERLQEVDAVGDVTVPAQELMSKSLQDELHACVCKPWLIQHALFRLLTMIDAAWFVRFCTATIFVDVFRDADDLFHVGVPATAAMVVVGGQLTYSQTPGQSYVDEVYSTPALAGTWLAEPALWCEWVHVGTATARNICKVLSLKVDKFWQACQAHRLIGVLAAEYGKQYYKRVTSAGPPLSDWPTDLAVPHTDFGDLVNSMPKSARQAIGVQTIRSCSNAFETLSIMHRRPTRSQEDLLSEVRAGTCTVVMDGNGRLARIVSVLVVRIENAEGLVFVQLGKWDGMDVIASCEMPGGKCQEDEVAQDAFRRILQSKLAAMEDSLELISMESTTAERASGQYAVHTKYLRTVCHARFRGELALPVCTHVFRESRAMAGVNAPMKKTRSNSRSGVGPTASASDEKMLPEGLLRANIYFMSQSSTNGQHPTRGTFHAWLTVAEMEQLQKPAVQPSLEAWLNGFELPKSAVTDDIEDVEPANSEVVIVDAMEVEPSSSGDLGVRDAPDANTPGADIVRGGMPQGLTKRSLP